jgi:hypothetical protein
MQWSFEPTFNRREAHLPPQPTLVIGRALSALLNRGINSNFNMPIRYSSGISVARIPIGH